MNNIKLIKPFVIGMVSLSLIGCNNEAPKANGTEKTETVVEDNKDTNKDVNKDTTKDTAKTKEDNKDTSAKTDDTKKTDTTKKEEVKTADAKEEKEKDVNKEDTSKNTDYQERDGSYISTLMSQGAGNSEISETLSDVKAEGDTLTVKGKLDYRENPDSIEQGEILDENTYKFKIDKNTKFQAVGGLADPEVYTVEGFNDFYKEVKDSGLALIIIIQNGIATEVNISS